MYRRQENYEEAPACRLLREPAMTMVRSSPVDPRNVSFAHNADPATPRGSVGVLLCHGFTGAPASLRPWADRLAEAGFSVRLPLLPGHGTRWQDANRTTFADWLAEATTAMAELSRTCRAVVAAGLSMGGTLALRLAELHPTQVSALVLVNPSVLSLRKEIVLLPLLKHLLPSFPGIVNDIALPGGDEAGYPRNPLKAMDSLRRAWADVRSDLAEVTAPTLLLHSRTDHVVEPENTRVVLGGISSSDVTEVWLDNSYHVATLDYDADLIFDRSIEFIDRVCRVAE